MLAYQLIPTPGLIHSPDLILSMSKKADVSTASGIILAHYSAISAAPLTQEAEILRFDMPFRYLSLQPIFRPRILLSRIESSK